MRSKLTAAVVAFAAIALTACDEQATENLTEPSVPQGTDVAASQQENGGTIEQDERPLVNLLPFPVDGSGSVTLNRKVQNNTLHWQLNAENLPPGHAYTIWIGNFTETPHDGGWGDGGIVGGSGKLTASGNHCVWDLVTFTEGGFRPGTKPNCQRIDVEGPVTFFLLDHGDWEPGDMLERWDPNGVVDSSGEEPTQFEGVWGAFFDPLD